MTRNVDNAVRDLNKVPSTRATVVGLTLAATIILGWLLLHIYAIFFFEWRETHLLWASVLVLLLCWLYVGLFIVAHDCMHGSLAPGRRWLNKIVGQTCLGLYAAFSFDALNAKHHEHHKHSGTAEDPDFHEEPPHSFFAWYAKFFTEYFGLRELAIIALAVAVYHLFLGAPIMNIWVFWALPALLSSVQLFYFGTYLPHKPGANPFVDRHNTRTNDYSKIVSLLTCFHFGYHHEHHLFPRLPWWRLPEVHDHLTGKEET